MKNKQDNRGGKRPNSGRKKSEYETKTISFRIRPEWETELKAIFNQFKSMKTIITIIAISFLTACSTPEVEETNPKTQTNLNCQCATILRADQFTLIGSPKSGSETGWITVMTIENNCDRVQETLTVKGYYKVGDQYCK